MAQVQVSILPPIFSEINLKSVVKIKYIFVIFLITKNFIISALCVVPSGQEVGS